MHRIRNPAYRFSCTEGSNPSYSAKWPRFPGLFCICPALGEWPDMKTLIVLMVSTLLQGCTLLAIADAAGSAVVYGVKTTVNVLDAVTPDIINKKKD